MCALLWHLPTRGPEIRAQCVSNVWHLGPIMLRLLNPALPLLPLPTSSANASMTTPASLITRLGTVTAMSGITPLHRPPRYRTPRRLALSTICRPLVISQASQMLHPRLLLVLRWAEFLPPSKVVWTVRCAARFGVAMHLTINNSETMRISVARGFRRVG